MFSPILYPLSETRAMDLSRRKFVATAASAMAMGSMACSGESETATVSTGGPIDGIAPDRLDPWIELEPAAFRNNLEFLTERCGRPIAAVVKCNGYGLDHRVLGPLLDPAPQIAFFAVVTVDEAIELRGSGVKKPILLMGDFIASAELELANNDITLAVYTPDAPRRLAALAERTGRAVRVHPYIDTGFHRLGMDVRVAEAWVTELAESSAASITGTMTELTQHGDFDKEQIRIFAEFGRTMANKGVELGPMHAAASDAIIKHPEGTFDMIRPGNLIYGIPASPDDDEAARPVRVVFRMKARVIRIVELMAGETLGYSRGFAPDRETDVAIIKCGRTAGYVYRGGQGEAVALINGEKYPLVADINSSHCYAELGKNHGVQRLDVVTLIGPEDGIRPQDLARITQRSRYESFNIDARIPKIVV
jgi:alanine racemase